MESVIEKLLRYVSFDTQSDTQSKTHPSSRSQLDFAAVLCDELKSIGLLEVEMDDKGYVTATLPASTNKKVPVIGFIAHMDTSPDMSGKNVKPRTVTAYDGGNIVLNREKGIVLSPSEFPDLLKYKGEDLIVTDGTTLLGADDKAGVAEIAAAVEYLSAHPEIEHGKLRICFTPDEEIGEGADNFKVDKFGADFAYTIDGDELGSLEYENFNAAKASIIITGRNVHPGSSKNKMKNSTLIGMEFCSMVPAEMPSNTEGYEGFYHLHEFSGTVEATKFEYIIRDHDAAKFENKKKRLEKIASYLNDKYGPGTVSLEIRDQYYNMKEKIAPVMDIVELAKKAMLQSGVTPLVKPVRGGTDGARLSYMGLPTPNIFTGGHNFHGKYEFIPVGSMKKAVEVIVKIAELAVI